MSARTIAAHFDGKHVVMDEPIELEPDTKLLLTVLPLDEDDRELWGRFSLQNLARAYDDNEPEYDLSRIKEWNPEYEGR